MSILGLVHVNINCSHFGRSRAFYERLGFELYMEVQPRNTPEVSGAVGFQTYEIKGGLMRLKDAPSPFMIDLLEWKEPFDSTPPYARLNHLGLARIALASSDLEGDMARLQAEGVEFLSEPATVVWEGHPNSRFVCFKDPDGTVLELVEAVR